MSEPKLNASQRAAMAKATQTFEADEYIVREGDTTREMYMMIHGKVAVLKGEEKVAEISEPYSYFGEMSALLGEPRSATVRAIEKSEFMVIPGDKFETLIDVNPVIGKKVMQTLAERLASMNKERLALIDEATKARRKVAQDAGAAAGDYKRFLYASALIFEKYKLPQVAELVKFGKESSLLASHSARLDLDDRFFQCNPLILELHQAKNKK